MIHFDPSEIANWADKPDAHYKIPELLRRLILATVPAPTLLSMPSGSSVRMPGWDGLLDVACGNTWTPKGASAWEFSCERDPKQKANRDYRKRTEDSRHVNTSQTMFVFVTPRRWQGKSDWVRDRVQEAPWADVRDLDADDLSAWLEQAPAVAHWFSRLIGKLPDTGIIPLDEWWETWSSSTQPKITPDLVLAGRSKQVKTLGEWFKAAAGHWYLQGDTRDEAIAFLGASAQTSAAQWGSAFLARAVVVQTAEAWRSLEHHPYPLVLVRDFDGIVSPQIAVGNGHHVLTPLGGSQDPHGNGQTLPRLGRDETVKALTVMGLSDHEAGSLARKTARRLSILRRFLLDDAGYPVPDWATSPSESLIGLILIGQWEESSEGDKDVIERLVGKPLTEIEDDITALAVTPDPPIVKVGQHWRLASHEEAWHCLASRLTPTLVARFKELASEVLGKASPEFELPVEERYLAVTRRMVLPHSSTLRHGIARSLALMGVHPEHARSVEAAAYIPSHTVSCLLAEGQGWHIWATLGNDLATLAEAAPDALLDAVERDLSFTSSPFKHLLAQEGNRLFPGALHTGLVWALERLAWSKEHFARVAMILARLAEIDPGGRVNNRPAESLRNLFLPWIRFSETSDKQRLETLQTLLDRHKQAGWRLIVQAYPSVRDFVLERRPPDWRPWGHDASLRPTRQECREFTDAIGQSLISHVQEDAERWADLVDIISNLSLETRKQALDQLLQRAEVLRQRPAALDLWAKIRSQLYRHRSHPDADWAMAAADVTKLAAAYEKLTPHDPVLATAWLFDGRPRLPNPASVDQEDPNGWENKRKRVEKAQQDAIQAVYEHGGYASVVGLAEVANAPNLVGIAVSFALDSSLATSLALPHIGVTNPKLREFAHGIMAALFDRLGWDHLELVLNQLKANGAEPNQIAALFLSAHANKETWQRLESESQVTQDSYWRTIPVFHILPRKSEEVSFGAQRLIDVQRSPDVVELISHADIADALAIQVLEQAPIDLSRQIAAGHRPQVDAYDIACLFEKLDRSNDVPDDVIARLEVPYLQVLHSDRPKLALHREVIKAPSIFADLISWAFKRSDEQADEMIDEQPPHRRAEIAFDILWRLHGLPGMGESGVVDPENLAAWVNEARRLCKERRREVIGEQQIGRVLANAPTGTDGIWPCEPVRDLLDALELQEIGRGFIIGKSNLRGVTSRRPLDGGSQERSLSREYRANAERIATRWPFTAQLLRKMAVDYESDARLFDQRSDWLDQFQA